jgi:hypothetical protein
VNKKTKLRGKGTPTLKEQVYVLKSIASEMRLLHITMNGEKARDINYALSCWSRAMDGESNGYVFSKKSVTEYSNKAFWKLSRLVCSDYEFMDYEEIA